MRHPRLASWLSTSADGFERHVQPSVLSLGGNRQAAGRHSCVPPPRDPFIRPLPLVSCLPLVVLQYAVDVGPRSPIPSPHRKPAPSPASELPGGMLFQQSGGQYRGRKAPRRSGRPARPHLPLVVRSSDPSRLLWPLGDVALQYTPRGLPPFQLVWDADSGSSETPLQRKSFVSLSPKACFGRGRSNRV